MSDTYYIRVKELLGLSNRLRAAQGRPALRSWWHLHRVMRVAGVPMWRAESRAIFYERRAAMEAVEEWENNHRREHPAQAHVRMSGTEYRERFYELPTVARLLGRSRVWVNDRVTGYELRAVWHPSLHRLVVMDADLLKFIKNAQKPPQGGRIGATRQKPPKNARAGKVASVPAREGIPPCQVYAKVGKR